MTVLDAHGRPWRGVEDEVEARIARAEARMAEQLVACIYGDSPEARVRALRASVLGGSRNELRGLCQALGSVLDG